GRQGVDRRLDLGVDVVEKDGLLGREVPEERPPADVGSLGDGAHRRLDEALLGEQGQSGIDDRRPGAIHVPLAKPWHLTPSLPPPRRSRQACRLALGSNPGARSGTHCWGGGGGGGGGGSGGGGRRVVGWDA